MSTWETIAAAYLTATSVAMFVAYVAAMWDRNLPDVDDVAKCVLAIGAAWPASALLIAVLWVGDLVERIQELRRSR